ncbi:MAG: MBL fold metallo-hydrolase [Gammaproteobacteria bacterium]|nr:MBL fold metallo-hydrolase [Gammaproteobacteria bacterium]
MHMRLIPGFLAAAALSIPATLVAAPAHAGTASDGAIEFCLEGEFDLGKRLQGMQPNVSEMYPTQWCVITEDDSDRVQFMASGHSNPDMSGSFTVAYLPPDTVRIVNSDDPPDLVFVGADIIEEARRNRRIDPKRVVAELKAHPDWVVSTADDGWKTVQYPGEPTSVRVRIVDGHLQALHTTAELPLRGTVPVRWTWDWQEPTAPRLAFHVDGEEMFRATGSWRTLDAESTEAVWAPSGNVEPREIPGSAWPARTAMRLEQLSDDVYLVRGVRTGFTHMVIDTEDGLVVGDAPAGWVELPQVPPADLVPGLGVSGLSEKFIDFLRQEFPQRKIHAVALTHAHDDHAGGARAFAAAGADVHAPAAVSEYLEAALNRDNMPADRLKSAKGKVDIEPVTGNVALGDGDAVLMNIGSGPHVSASLGLWAKDAGYFFVSDLHVPTSESDEPRKDRLATECWFAKWAVKNLPAETIVVNSHSSVRTPVSRLASYTRHADCS